MIEDDEHTLLEALPRWAIEDEESNRIVLGGILGPIVEMQARYLAKMADLDTLLDPERVPDRLVIAIGRLVGVGWDLPAARATSAEDLRRYVAAAADLWRTKGSRDAARTAGTAAQGRTIQIVDWWDVRIVTGATFPIATWPDGAPGSDYDGTPYVADVWIMDPGADADLDLVSAWLGATARPTGRTINLRRALFVDDHRNGAGWYTPSGSPGASISYDTTARAITMAGGELAVLSITDADTWSDYRATFKVEAADEVGLVVLADDDGSEGYVVAHGPGIASGKACEIIRRIGGVETTIASTDAVVGAGPYVITVDVRGVYGGTSIRVRRSGALILEFIDTNGARRTAGRVGLEARGGSVLVHHVDVRPHDPASVTIGPPT